VIEDVGEKIGRMLSAEAFYDCTVEGRVDQIDGDDTIIRFTKEYV
jgi:hypothetical protein